MVITSEAARQVVDVLEMVTDSAVGIAFAFAVVSFDERRLRGIEAERAWPLSSKRAALVLFTMIALPLHFLRTRRSFLGVAMAVGSLVAFVLVNVVLAAAFDAAFN